MIEKNESKKAYRRPEITSRKLSLGVYGSYGVTPPRSEPDHRGGHDRDWKSF